METGSEPALLPDKQMKVRNDVLHNRRLPDRAEAVVFGQAVCDCAVRPLRGMVLSHIATSCLSLQRSASASIER